MRKSCIFIWLALMVWIPSTTFAQKADAQKPTYYIYVNSGLSRENVLAIEKNIRNHSAVVFFSSIDFPMKYFLMRTNQPVKESLFRSWLGTSATLAFYGEKGPALERFMANEKLTAKKPQQVLQ